MRHLTDDHLAVLRMMAEGWDLVTHWPMPDIKKTYLRRDGEADRMVGEYHLAMLKKAPRLIRTYRTEPRPACLLHYCLTPAGRRAIAGAGDTVQS